MILKKKMVSYSLYRLSDIDFKKNVTAVVNSLNRNDSSSNHTSTHLYIKFRNVSGDH